MSQAWVQTLLSSSLSIAWELLSVQLPRYLEYPCLANDFCWKVRLVVIVHEGINPDIVERCLADHETFVPRTNRHLTAEYKVEAVWLNSTGVQDWIEEILCEFFFHLWLKIIFFAYLLRVIHCNIYLVRWQQARLTAYVVFYQTEFLRMSACLLEWDGYLLFRLILLRLANYSYVILGSPLGIGELVIFVRERPEVRFNFQDFCDIDQLL